MAEKVLYNNFGSKEFPFEYVRSRFSSSLAAILHDIEQGDQQDPRASFVTAINTILVWTGARTASLPCWAYCKERLIVELVERLNDISRQTPSKVGTIDEVILLGRPQVYCFGGGTHQKIIVRKHNPRVSMTADRPVDDHQIGRELDMYPSNILHFAGCKLGETAFTIWEVGSEALLYSEVWSDKLLSTSQLKEFLDFCDKRLGVWNSAMEKLGLTYRFYGTMDSRRSEMVHHRAEKTKRFCGREFLGEESRSSLGTDGERHERIW
jgi:hypothetical protein